MLWHFIFVLSGLIQNPKQRFKTHLKMVRKERKRKRKWKYSLLSLLARMAAQPDLLFSHFRRPKPSRWPVLLSCVGLQHRGPAANRAEARVPRSPSLTPWPRLRASLTCGTQLSAVPPTSVVSTSDSASIGNPPLRHLLASWLALHAPSPINSAPICICTPSPLP